MFFISYCLKPLFVPLSTVYRSLAWLAENGPTKRGLTNYCHNSKGNGLEIIGYCDPIITDSDMKLLKF